MTQRERQLLEWIRENPMISQQELADKAGITRSSTAVHISNLMKKGYIAGRGYLLRTAPYIVVIGGGGEGDKLRAMAGPTIRFLGGGLSDEEVRGYYLRAKAFLFPGEEDFGITPVEAQSAGTPVLAFGRGGACETVLDGKTGLLFDEQTPESLEACIQKFETEGVDYPPQQIREHSRSFSEQRFEDELRDYCTRRYADWQRELEACSHHETAKEAEE